MKAYSMEEARVKINAVASKAFAETGGVIDVGSSYYIRRDAQLFSVEFYRGVGKERVSRADVLMYCMAVYYAETDGHQKIPQSKMTAMLSDVLILAEKEKALQRFAAYQQAKQSAAD
jgi:hypothetical protein